jgi:DNA-binding PadR family transcriptional regulator
VAVLLALADRPSEWRYGYELGQEIGLKAGSLYPILIRLCDRGLLEATWESDPPPGRPPRHLYRLTGAGVRLAGELAPASASARASASASARASASAPAARRRGVPRGAW